MESEFRFGIKRRIYNWQLRTARLAKGMNQEDLGKKVGLSSSTVCKYECLRGYPSLERAKMVADVLDVSVATLFPEWLEDFKLREVPQPSEDRTFTLDEARDMNLFPPAEDTIEAVEEKVDRELLKERVGEILLGLEDREREILKLRFGIDDGISRTLSDIASMYGVSRERVRQVEAKALRKMRHPSRGRRLK